MTSLYRYFNSCGTLLYVGISANAVARLIQHRSTPWFERVVRIDIERYRTRSAAEAAEAQAIIKECPLYNVECTPTETRKERKDSTCQRRKTRKPLNLSVDQSTKRKAFQLATLRGCSISMLVTALINEAREAAKPEPAGARTK